MQQRVTSMDLRWLNFNPHHCQALKGCLLLPLYAKATHPKTVGVFGVGAANDLGMQPRTAYCLRLPTARGLQHLGKIRITPLRRSFAARKKTAAGSLLKRICRTFASFSRPEGFPLENYWARTTHEALDVRRAAPQTRKVLPYPTRAQSPADHLVAQCSVPYSVLSCFKS